MKFELTYATMFDPPAEMDARFEAALAEVRGGLGARHLLHINGRTARAESVKCAIVRSISVCCLVIFRAPARPRLNKQWLRRTRLFRHGAPCLWWNA